MNFVIFCADQQRSESLGLYGHPLTRTPNYDSLAEGGAVFENAFCQSVLCTPSRCSFLTGLYPHANGHRSLWHLLRSHEPNLFRSLRDAGYHTAHFGKNDVWAPDSIPLALDEYRMPTGVSNNGQNPFDIADPRYYSFLTEPHPGGVDGTMDAKTVGFASDFLASRRGVDDPFLCFVPITLPHPPYGPPEPYYSRHSPDDVPALRSPVPHEDLESYPAFHRLVREYRRLNELDDAFFRRINALYLGMNEYVDMLFGRLMDALDASGHADDTTVIVMSDHGDFAGDYGLVEKYHTAHYDCMTRVPLIVHGPGGHARRVEQPVGLIDLPATIAELAGVELGYTHHSNSLVELANGAPEDPDAMVFAENGFNVDETQGFELLSVTTKGSSFPEGSNYYPQSKQVTEHRESYPRTLMARSATEKLILRPREQSEYYDLEDDPRETRNLYPAATATPDSGLASRVARMRGRVLDWMVLTSDTIPTEHDPRFWETPEWRRDG